MAALVLASAVTFTMPHLAAGPSCDVADSLRTLPATPWDSLRAECVFRRQAPSWAALAESLAAGSRTAWAQLWPRVRLEADSAWTRTVYRVAGVRDTVRSPVLGPGLYVEVTILRRGAPGNRSCVAKKGLTP